jgi:hypothetical protein
LITADQLLAHAIGDYILQSNWMATEKTKKSIAALAHVATYGLPFLILRPSWKAYAVIVATHFIIDRWRLARWLVATKNVLGDPLTYVGKATMTTTQTGYPAGTPDWLAVWLLIIADNLMHVVINGLALKFL